MKKIILLFLFILSFITLYGQNLYPDTGKVGLGTNVPRSKLEIADWIASLNISSSKYTEVMTDNEVVGAINFYKHYGLANAASIRLLQSGGNSNYGQAHLALCTSNAWNPYTAVPVERMRITSSGNIGIGTSNPKFMLDVNGGVRAREVKVEAGVWPDYVFSRFYSLPDLFDTERFINENKHLPGIPSASDVQKNGIDLGEMNAKLLEKIEELTLYLIEMKKDNGKQDLIIQALQSSNARLTEEFNTFKNRK